MRARTALEGAELELVEGRMKLYRKWGEAAAKVLAQRLPRQHTDKFGCLAPKTIRVHQSVHQGNHDKYQSNKNR